MDINQSLIFSQMVSVEILEAYFNCTHKERSSIHNMIKVIKNQDVAPEDQTMATKMIHDFLSPHFENQNSLWV